MRRLVVDGRAVATGIVTVGDATASTDPSLGRGDVDRTARCLRPPQPVRGDLGNRLEVIERWDERTRREVSPFVDETMRTSAHRLAQIDAQIAGVPYQPEDPRWWFGQSLAAAARSDPELLRAQFEVGAMLTTGAEVASRPGVRQRVAAAPPAAPPPGPDRGALLGLLDAARPAA